MLAGGLRDNTGDETAEEPERKKKLQQHCIFRLGGDLETLRKLDTFMQKLDF